ncbi:acetyl-CoA carboxylase, biotin carboxyl carrier protein [candidate division WOR-1 bacterium RIFCSPLOWO2_02_FULL_46_20]|uniref:Biotin carboxyl carrier protein of acetyl-CoA carboxylase n=1 Tax=candidate division WOR-1 bacterium RIFCSPLOWO2_02_FULL_46_20 TaxID=1802567 RepID=A0A1F4R4Z8_UNCSA|nr:MAG: acetyl-CoA carboxylase, biotin carboxyl carrier protein [candidate division WOR-1 bacterium RIFCSPHIGHO2_02_FULL_45_12]OGC03176.1 MAG: acetyl-CoA carboxylase, biotin carboxyl carrier protein [candidate division WOR-1 bacterium RIFCSPLOWO2_02_FULL_46_20]
MADWEIVKRLIQMVKEEDISGLSIEENGIKYEVRREKGGVVSTHLPAAHLVMPAAESAEAAEDQGLVAITSPMVGTFYRAPSPEAPSFVNAGDEVEVGKVVCIVEAMKLFNEIEAEVKGKVVKVLVENGQPVEYGQKLILIKKG